jgi:hypothetical protein
MSSIVLTEEHESRALVALVRTSGIIVQKEFDVWPFRVDPGTYLATTSRFDADPTTLQVRDIAKAKGSQGDPALFLRWLVETEPSSGQFVSLAPDALLWDAGSGLVCAPYFVAQKLKNGQVLRSLNLCPVSTGRDFRWGKDIAFVSFRKAT